MELKPFIPDDKFFDDLAEKFKNEYISLDYRDLLYVRRCKDIMVYEAVRNSSFDGSVDEFVDTFLKEVRTHLEGQIIDHVLVCIIPDNDVSILMETMCHLNEFMEILGKKTEARWGLCHGEEGIPMRLIVVIGKEA